MVTLVIEGQLPNLNDYTKACRTYKMAGAKMKKDAERMVSFFILQQLHNVKFEGAVELNFRWYAQHQTSGLDNICFAKKFILDALVSNGTIMADGWKGVIGFTDSFFVDKENPRIEVDIQKAGVKNG